MEEGKVIQMTKQVTDEMDRKRKCMLGVVTMIMIGEFIDEDILQLGEEKCREYHSKLTDAIDVCIDDVEEEGPPDILEMEEDMNKFQRALKKFIHREMEEE